MGFNMIETNGQVQYNVSIFVIDSPDDLKTLPKKCALQSLNGVATNVTITNYCYANLFHNYNAFCCLCCCFAQQNYTFYMNLPTKCT